MKRLKQALDDPFYFDADNGVLLQRLPRSNKRTAWLERSLEEALGKFRHSVGSRAAIDAGGRRALVYRVCTCGSLPCVVGCQQCSHTYTQTHRRARAHTHSQSAYDRAGISLLAWH